MLMKMSLVMWPADTAQNNGWRGKLRATRRGDSFAAAIEVFSGKGFSGGETMFKNERVPGKWLTRRPIMPHNERKSQGRLERDMTTDMTTDTDKTVFISYRREVSSFVARTIFLDLKEHGYDVFMDVESMDSGTFDTIILNQIEARAHFLVLLTPGSVERCQEPGDWLRREIEFAMDKGRNIVPVLAHGFKFQDYEKYLTGKLGELPHYNGLPLYHEYFNEAMERLKTRFLKQPVTGAIKATSPTEAAEVARKIEETASQPPPTQERLTAEEYLARGNIEYFASNYGMALANYTEAIRLNPKYAWAYRNRGLARDYLGDLIGAITDYDQAISLDPQDVAAYYNRGLARYDQGDLDGAIRDYDQAIRLDPQDAAAHYNRGEAYYAQGQQKHALVDFEKANQLEPGYKWAIAGLGVTLHALGREEEAKERWQSLLATDERFLDAEWVGAELEWRPELIEEARKLIAKL
jgi:tetratricopeptide (TPR) repeat protein